MNDIYDSILDLQHSFNELQDVGVISIDTLGIHVDEDFLLKMPGCAIELKHKDFDFPWKTYKIYKGVTFFAVSEDRLSDRRE